LKITLSTGSADNIASIAALSELIISDGESPSIGHELLAISLTHLCSSVVENLRKYDSWREPEYAQLMREAAKDLRDVAKQIEDGLDEE